MLNLIIGSYLCWPQNSISSKCVNSIFTPNRVISMTPTRSQHLSSIFNFTGFNIYLVSICMLVIAVTSGKKNLRSTNMAPGMSFNSNFLINRSFRNSFSGKIIRYHYVWICKQVYLHRQLYPSQLLFTLLEIKLPCIEILLNVFYKSLYVGNIPGNLVLECFVSDL